MIALDYFAVQASQDASLSQLKAQSMVAADLLVEMQDLLKQMQDSCDSKKDLVQQQQTESRGLGRKLAQYMQQVQRMQKQLASVGYSPEVMVLGLSIHSHICYLTCFFYVGSSHST